MEMKKYKLGDIGKFANGSKRPSKRGVFPVFGGNGIMDYANVYNYDESIIIGRVGAYCGNVYLSRQKCWISDNAISFIPNENHSFEYLTFLLQSLNLNKKHTGAAQPLMTQDDLKKIEIFLPSLPEQKRIAKFLTDIDSKIALNKKINKELEAMAKEVYDYWFVQFDFPGADDKPYKSSGGKMVFNPILKREIPEGWEVEKLENVMNVNRGGSPRPIDEYISDKGLHWLKISDATASSSPFILDTKEYIIESGLKKTVMMKTGSIVLSNSATPGMPRILDIDTCIHDGWLYFSKTELSNEFLYLFFLKMRENIVKLANGSIFLNLKTDVVKDFKMILPTKDILQKFDNIVKPIFSQMLNLEKEVLRLQKLRDELLPMLMNGQVEVY